MNTARPVPSTPASAFVSGCRRIARYSATTPEIATATIAAVSRSASALTVTNATGPRPVSTSTRGSRSMSSGLGGRSGVDIRTAACAPRASGCRRGAAARECTPGPRLPRREHRVEEGVRRHPRLHPAPVDRLQQQVAAVRVLDPAPRDVLRLAARLERAVEPAEPVGEQLLAPHPHV